MARASTNKLYRTFVKGLVTEASPLTYPEDASFDELNTVLSRKGSRTRRLGMNYEANTIENSLADTHDHPYWSQSEYIWKSVSKEAGTNFLCVQRGLNVNFFDSSSTVAATSFKSFSIDLGDYLIPGWTRSDAHKQIYQMASGKGFLFIVGRPIKPVVVEYDPVEDDITVNGLRILIRDFDGLNDGLANDEEPFNLTKEHHYNLLNQGWLYGTSSQTTFSPVSYTGYTLRDTNYRYNIFQPELTNEVYSQASGSSSPITIFKNHTGRYPGNNKQWWVARAEADNPDENIKAGDFLPDVLNNLYSGNNRAPNGHFLIDAFYKDRTGVSGVSDIPIEEFQYRPEAITFFSGRAWYAAESTVYFSQIIDSTGFHKAALCYQEADPTAEDISDLIQSDGGVVPIPEAVRIRNLIPMGNGVLVLAQNGVWFISGGDAAFAATGISVNKVSNIGTKSPYANIVVDETLFWWSETGIQAMQQASGQFGPVPGKFGNTSISEQTIQSLFNEIDEDAKVFTKGAYDPRNNQIVWIYKSTNNNYKHDYNNALIFDLTLQAFFKWEFEVIIGGPDIVGVYNNEGVSYASEDVGVLNSGGVAVVDSGGQEVVTSSYIELYAPSTLNYIVNIPGESFGIAQLSDTNFVDWASYDGTGVAYESFVETGYELMADSMRDKQTTYVFCHFRQADNSSCEMTAKWDWSSGTASNRETPPVEVYKDRIRPKDSAAALKAFEVVTTKNKVRGSGKALQFKFGTSEIGKNFELLGWSVAYSGSTQP